MGRIGLRTVLGCAAFLVGAPGVGHAFVCAAPTAWPETGPVHEFYSLGSAGVVVGADQGAFRIDATSNEPKRMAGPSTGPVLEMQPLGGGGALFRAERGIFAIDPAARRADPVRGPATGALKAVEALDGGALIVAEKGLFAVASGMGSLDPVNSSGVAGPYKVHGLRDGVALVAAQEEVFRLRAADSGLKRLDGPSPGTVQSFFRLQDGGVLLRATHGLFYVDAEGSKLRSANPPELGTVQAIIPLDGGGALIRTDQILFHIETAADGLRQARTGLERPLDPDSWSPGWIHALASGAGLPKGTALIGTDAGLFVVDLAASTLTPLAADRTGGVSTIAALGNGTILVGADQGLFRLRLAPLEMTPAGGPPIGAVDEIFALKGGTALVAAHAGLFRRDADGRMTGIAGSDLGIRRVHALDDGGALIESERGLLYLGAAGAAPKPVAGTRIERIEELRPIGGGGALVIAGGHLLQFDRPALRIGPLAGPADSLSIRHYFPLADGTALISGGGANTALAVPDFARSDVRLSNLAMVDNRRPGAPPAEARWTLESRCAPVASKLGLTVLAQPVDAPASGANAASAGPPALRIPALTVENGTSMATVVAGIALPSGGKWSLQLAATSSGVDQPIGAPVTVSAGSSIWNWLKP